VVCIALAEYRRQLPNRASRHQSTPGHLASVLSCRYNRGYPSVLKALPPTPLAKNAWVCGRRWCGGFFFFPLLFFPFFCFCFFLFLFSFRGCLFLGVVVFCGVGFFRLGEGFLFFCWCVGVVWGVGSVCFFFFFFFSFGCFSLLGAVAGAVFPFCSLSWFVGGVGRGPGRGGCGGGGGACVWVLSLALCVLVGRFFFFSLSFFFGGFFLCVRFLRFPAGCFWGGGGGVGRGAGVSPLWVGGVGGGGERDRAPLYSGARRAGGAGELAIEFGVPAPDIEQESSSARLGRSGDG